MSRLDDLYQHAKRQFTAIGIESAALDARLLLCHALKLSHEDFALQGERILSAAEISKIEALIDQRLQRKPVAKIIGEKEFYGLTFITSEKTLDPRPDSETLIDAVLQTLADKNKPLKILDLGTGTGCLLLTLVNELPKASGIGVDQSKEALIIARENALRLGLLNCADFIQSDWFDNVEGSFDVIISNPPYIPSDDIAGLAPDVRDYDPTSALDGGKDGLEAYRQIISKAKIYLKKGGFIAFEVGQEQSQDVSKLLEDNGFFDILVRKDIADIERVVLGKCL